MASFRQRNNTWRAEISVNGIRESSTFDTKAQARAWASKRETQLREQSHGKLPDHSFLEAIERYLNEVSIKKKTHDNEVKRMAFFKREYKKLCQKQLTKVTTDDLVQWRDSRLKEVQGATVRREANILASLFTVARKEWKWIKESPMADLTLPPPSKHRDRRITQDEIDRLCLAANWDNNVPVNSTQQVIVAFLNIDPIPLEPIVTMNLAHYQNSASYEEMVFICGQAQPVINELDEGWRDWLQKNGVRLGSKNPLMLPKGSSFDYKQVTESTLAKQAMDAKENYMQAMGAKILETEQVNKTATQSNNEKLAQYSVLSLCVANTNEAMEYALKWCAAYYGSGSKAKLTIKQDFAKGKIDLDTLKFYWEMVLANRMSMETFHELLTTGKVPEISYEDEQTRIESESVNRPMVV
ncbi:DUF4055 domain-containing protein [Acinetobacter pittii]|nr:DUF4055 domain-containing protein [Acinetobacter pittii]